MSKTKQHGFPLLKRISLRNSLEAPELLRRRGKTQVFSVLFLFIWVAPHITYVCYTEAYCIGVLDKSVVLLEHNHQFKKSSQYNYLKRELQKYINKDTTS